MRHLPRKRFGQHFLVDDGVIDAILQAVDPLDGQCLVEIGPGLGALTLALLQRIPRLSVIEVDRDLAGHWRKDARVQVIEADVLRVPFRIDNFCPPTRLPSTESADPIQHASSPPGRKLRVVGNLPYNISTPILFHLLSYVDQVADQHFMLQKEVIDRMVAPPATADYGRLSVMLQWRYEMENFLAVPPEAFDPPPRVQSAVVRMLPRSQPIPIAVSLLEDLVKVAFSQRRKLLRHTLGRWLEERRFSGQFDCQRRAEEVSVAEYVALAKALPSPC